MNSNAGRIYKEGLPSSEPPRPRRGDSETAPVTLIAAPVISITRPSTPAPTRAAKVQTIAAQLERDIRDIIEAAPQADETTEIAFRRKEQALRDLFSTLTVIESRALHRRLTLGSATDPLVKTFCRMIAERRARLLAFLADVRRREAIDSVRKVAR